MKLLCKKIKLTQKPIQSHQTDANVTTRNNICVVCMKTNNKIDFVSKTCQRTMVVQNTFTSSFSCKCQTSCKYETGRSEFVFKYRINNNDHERSYGDIIDTNDAKLDEFVQKLNQINWMQINWRATKLPWKQKIIN